MADTEKSGTWVNTFLNEEETKMLDEMVAEQGSDRAKFMRWMIRKESEERKRTKKLLNRVRGQRVSP